VGGDGWTAGVTTQWVDGGSGDGVVQESSGRDQKRTHGQHVQASDHTSDTTTPRHHNTTTLPTEGTVVSCPGRESAADSGSEMILVLLQFVICPRLGVNTTATYLVACPAATLLSRLCPHRHRTTGYLLSLKAGGTVFALPTHFWSPHETWQTLRLLTRATPKQSVAKTTANNVVRHRQCLWCCQRAHEVVVRVVCTLRACVCKQQRNDDLGWTECRAAVCEDIGHREGAHREAVACGCGMGGGYGARSAPWK
jgi:hypothetical protein